MSYVFENLCLPTYTEQWYIWLGDSAQRDNLLSTTQKTSRSIVIISLK